MGHREDLLQGAKQCLHERGYARTTARDIVAASGANLASIGYHYGSKEALLDAALIEAIAELSERLVQLTGLPDLDLPAGWDRVLAEFDAHRPLLISHVEAWAQVERSPALREKFSALYTRELEKGVEHIQTARPDVDQETAQAVSKVTGALADGLIVQWLINPEHLPTGNEIAAGLRALADAVEEPD